MNENDLIKRTRFIDIATKRTNNVCDSIRILTNCASDNYIYTEQDVKEMFNAIREMLDKSEMSFMSRIEKKKTFKFTSEEEVHDMKLAQFTSQKPAFIEESEQASDGVIHDEDELVQKEVDEAIEEKALENYVE